METKIPALRLGPIAIGGCVIRLPLASGGGVKPTLHHNGTHICVGIESVALSGGDIEVTATEALPIIACGVWMDETIGGMHGVTGGISGGGRKSLIRLNKGGKRLFMNSSGAEIGGPVSNLWCLWVWRNTDCDDGEWGDLSRALAKPGALRAAATALGGLA